jgi:hypothetical protein
MTTPIKPHTLFEVWSPDEVAECLGGTGVGDLYNKLWSLLPLLPEDTSEVPDNFESRSLAKVWSHLTEAEQTELNRLAVLNDEEMARLTRKSLDEEP